MSPSAPARLSVLLAADAPVGVILRRGPSAWVRCVRWDTARDVFELGQWFHGGIMPQALSPSGKWFAYFASRAGSPKEPKAWTAISRPPYLTALAFWPYSFGWDAGGRFLNDRTFERTYWQDRRPQENNEKPSPPPRVMKIVAAPRPAKQEPFPPKLADVAVDDRWVIRREYCRTKPVEQGKGLYHVRYALLDVGREMDLLTGAEWADVDQRGRLVFASGGRVLAASRRMNGAAEVNCLADLNEMTPDPQPAPAWAQTWTAPRRAAREFIS